MRPARRITSTSHTYRLISLIDVAIIILTSSAKLINASVILRHMQNFIYIFISPQEWMNKWMPFKSPVCQNRYSILPCFTFL